MKIVFDLFKSPLPKQNLQLILELKFHTIESRPTLEKIIKMGEWDVPCIPLRLFFIS